MEFITLDGKAYSVDRNQKRFNPVASLPSGVPPVGQFTGNIPTGGADMFAGFSMGQPTPQMASPQQPAQMQAVQQQAQGSNIFEQLPGLKSQFYNAGVRFDDSINTGLERLRAEGIPESGFGSLSGDVLHAAANDPIKLRNLLNAPTMTDEQRRTEPTVYQTTRQPGALPVGTSTAPTPSGPSQRDQLLAQAAALAQQIQGSLGQLAGAGLGKTDIRDLPQKEQVSDIVARTQQAGQQGIQPSTLFPTSGSVGQPSPQQFAPSQSSQAPSLPSQAPTPSPYQSPQTSALEQALIEALKPSSEETSLQQQQTALEEQLRNLNLGQQQTNLNLAGQPIAKPFITGQQAAVAQQYGIDRQAVSSQQQTLQQQLANVQARRQAALDVSKFGLERADRAGEIARQDSTRQAEIERQDRIRQEDIAREIASQSPDVQKPFGVSAGASVYDPATGTFSQAPSKPTAASGGTQGGASGTPGTSAKVFGFDRARELIAQNSNDTEEQLKAKLLEANKTEGLNLSVSETNALLENRPVRTNLVNENIAKSFTAAFFDKKLLSSRATELKTAKDSAKGVISQAREAGNRIEINGQVVTFRDNELDLLESLIGSLSDPEAVLAVKK